MTRQAAQWKSASAATFASITLLVSAPAISHAQDSKATAVEVRGGTAQFEAATNISAIRIHGKSAALTGRARVKTDGGTLAIEALDATLPVSTLGTGMDLRDSHMRKYVFTTSDGKTPDLHFAAERTACVANGPQSTCQLQGELSLRGTTRPFTISLKVSKEGDGFRAVGDSIVKLSTYGIDAPSQLGVRTQDDVKLHLEFTARPATAEATGGDQ